MTQQELTDLDRLLAENSRRKPVEFQTLQEAQEQAKRLGCKVWARIWSWTGVFEVYPGGRTIRREP